MKLHCQQKIWHVSKPFIEWQDSCAELQIKGFNTKSSFEATNNIDICKSFLKEKREDI